jgi:hypothetical protein
MQFQIPRFRRQRRDAPQETRTSQKLPALSRRKSPAFEDPKIGGSLSYDDVGRKG